MKTRQKWVRYPPLRYDLERVLRDMGGVSCTGPLSQADEGRGKSHEKATSKNVTTSAFLKHAFREVTSLENPNLLK